MNEDKFGVGAFGALMAKVGGAFARVVPDQAKAPVRNSLWFAAGVLTGKYASLGYLIGALGDALK